MSYVTENQPDGTPTWIDLGIPDLDRAMEFYGAVFDWELDVGPEAMGRYTHCLLNGKRVAAMAPNHDPNATDFWWNVYLATADIDATTKRCVDAGGTVIMGPGDIMDQGRMAMVRDAAGSQFGLWQGKAHIGCEVVNEPGALVRNDLATQHPGAAREFYAAVFDFTVEKNPDMSDMDFTFLRRKDGHEIGGVLGVGQGESTGWYTVFEVADTDQAVERVRAAGGTSDDAFDFIYGRMASMKDPFGTEFSVIARPKTG